LRLSRNINYPLRAAGIFSNYLQQRELKNTPERFIILNEIVRMRKHFEADSLLVQLRIKNKKISRATIYRTLELLIDCGLVKKNKFNTLHSYYEPVAALGQHDHFICLACGKIIEIYDKSIMNIQKKLQKSHRFSVLQYTYHLYGHCAACKRNPNRYE
jgi:Fur family transcriptional regulator, ferric uptake regulator